MKSSPDCLQAALTYAARGWHVLPVESHGKRPIGALVPHGVKDATTDEATIRRWWGSHPDASVGIAAGSVSGFDVLDVDGDEGEQTLAALEREHGSVPETVEALTGGGRHVLFEHVADLRNAVRFAPGLDVRTDGGYIVAAPSVHGSGREYAWEVTHHPDGTRLAAWPAWLIEMLTSSKSKAATGAVSEGGTIRDGQRNAHLASLAGSMRKRGMTEEEILAGLHKVNVNRCRPLLDGEEVARVARSISNYAPEASVDELLDGAGLKDLAAPVSGAALETILGNLSAKAKGATPIRRASMREEAMRRLKDAGVSSPAKAVDAALCLPPGEGEETKDRQGKALDFEEPQPWPEPVDGAALLDALVETIQKYVVLPVAGAEAAALWVLHTWTWREAADFTPRLGITGPAKRCGKSRLLEVLYRLVCRPLMTANVSPAALFRSVERHSPTVLVDEGDTFLRESEDLRGLLNAGQRRGGAVIRTVGEDFEPRVFNVFAPAAIALIGELPDTVRDRAILIPMRRKTKAEEVARLRWTPFLRECLPLRQQAARWALDHVESLGTAEPDLPDVLDDRAQDGWEPLLAVADAAGGEWPDRARNVAVGLSGSREAEEGSMGVQLLADMHGVFEKRGADRIPSAKLIDALTAREGSPWSDWRHGRPISARKVADLLRPFGIIPRTIRMPDKSTPKGYRLADCKDAFSRYLPASSRNTATPTDLRLSSTDPIRNNGRPVADGELALRPGNGFGGGVAAGEGPNPAPDGLDEYEAEERAAIQQEGGA